MGSVERKAPCAGGESLVLEYINWTKLRCITQRYSLCPHLCSSRHNSTNSHVFHRTSAFPYKSLLTVWSLYWMVKAWLDKFCFRSQTSYCSYSFICCFWFPWSISSSSLLFLESLKFQEMEEAFLLWFRRSALFCGDWFLINISYKVRDYLEN